MPNWLHIASIHSFVVIFEVNPPSKTIYYLLPVTRIPHHYSSTGIIIIPNTHLQSLFFVCYLQFFVNLVLNWQAMTIPSKTPFNKVTSLRCISTYYIFDGSSCNVAIMRGSSCKGRSVIKSVRRVMLSFSELLFKGINLLPILKDGLFLLRKGYFFRCCINQVLRILRGVNFWDIFEKGHTHLNSNILWIRYNYGRYEWYLKWNQSSLGRGEGLLSQSAFLVVHASSSSKLFDC